jgi:transcriptional regulator with XRE-family HTH domain
MNPDEMIVSNWLKAELEKRNLSTNALVDMVAAKMSRASVFFYVSGKRIPCIIQLKKLADALDIPHDQIPAYTPRKVGKLAQKKYRVSPPV